MLMEEMAGQHIGLLGAEGAEPTMQEEQQERHGHSAYLAVALK
jgi:hypothetical protein